MKFKSKKEFLEFVKHQINIDLPNDEYFLNKHKKILYTEIPKNAKFTVLSFLKKTTLEQQNI